MDEKSLSQLRHFLAEATVCEATEDDIKKLEEVPEFVQCFKQASPQLLDKQGRPRMLLLTAWIVHEGRNLNAQAFVKQELEKRVQQGLFSPPHPGMIDFNHDFEPRGIWYKSSFAFDPKADKWGIVASGALWAWRFPELADSLLAEMHREGSISVSMAALPESVEFTRNYPEAEGEFTEVLHNPVFFATSVLSVPPADPNARGNASETDDDVPVPATKKAEEEPSVEPTPVLATKHKEDKTMEKELEVLQQELDDTKTALQASEDKVKELEESKTDLEAKVAESETKIEALETKVGELEIALKSVSDVKTEIEGKLNEANDRLAEIESEKQEAAKDERLKTRIAELPKVVQENLDSHPEVEDIKASWREMDDEEWNTVRRSFDLATDSPDYVKRSEEEGVVPSGKRKDNDEGSGLSKYIKR
jgi:hypothetical protein